jgi:hypothetical protein
MIGHFNNSVMFENILWVDAELKEFKINYDLVEMTLKESSGLERQVVCHGHIGYRLIGFWDEIIIEKGELLTSGAFLSECEKKISTNLIIPMESGCEVRNEKNFSLLKITLIDGCEIEIVFSALEVFNI